MTQSDAYSPFRGHAQDDPWFSLVEGLDPRVPVTDTLTAAQATAMACAAYVLPPDDRRFRILRTGPQHQIRDWVRWLASAYDDHDAQLRRLALRLACTQAVTQDRPAPWMLKQATRLYHGSLIY
jgi:hypothetical protein